MIQPAAFEEIDAPQFKGHPVALEVFSGPLDLLLHLVQQEKIDIWEISIARITEEYLAYLRSLEALNVEIAGEFLVMAATLIRIKSQMLLPRPERPSAGEEAPLTREELIARLLEYRRYKEAALSLRRLEEERARKLARGWVPQLEKDHLYPLREARGMDLALYLREVLERVDAPPPLHEVHLEEIRLEDRIAAVLAALSAHEEPLLFTDLLDRKWWRLEWIVTFLAMLELARQARILILQEEALGPLWLVAHPQGTSSSGPTAGGLPQGE